MKLINSDPALLSIRQVMPLPRIALVHSSASRQECPSALEAAVAPSPAMQLSLLVPATDGKTFPSIRLLI